MPGDGVLLRPPPPPSIDQLDISTVEGSTTAISSVDAALQQAGTAMLAQANQLPQAVLSLLQ